MKSILVGVDGSPESRKAADYAAQIALATHSRLELAHVMPEIAEMGAKSMYTFSSVPVQTDRAQTMLHELSHSVPRGLTPVDTVLLEGNPAQVLADEAKQADVWLVVVGHRGRSPLERALIGSVADRLTQLCPKPLMVVR